MRKSFLIALGSVTSCSSFALYPVGNGGVSGLFDNIASPSQTEYIDYDLHMQQGIDVQTTTYAANTFGLTSYEAFTYASRNTLKSYSKLSSLGGISVGPNPIDYTAHSESYFDDNITIDAAGMTGEFGYFMGTMNYDGIFRTHSVAGGKNARARLILYQYYEGPDNGYAEYPHGVFTPILDTRLVGDGLGDSQEIVQGAAPFSFHFQYGTPFHIGMNVLARCRVFGDYTDADAWAESDFSHTIAWGGVSAITDNFGNVVNNPTVRVESGNNVFQPAPEPASIAVLGLGLLGFVRKRKRQA